tara:strand:+ start:371 stop:646 length:276 start_codon:yes stop_codon:yes gene_type:complete
MSDSIRKFEELKERELMFPKNKADVVMVRLGFSDMVVTMEKAMDNTNEICSPDCFVVGYEDSNGRECQSDGTYLNQNPNQIELFDDKVSDN